MSRVVLVTGGTGCIGLSFVRAARSAGLTVRGLARRPPSPAWIGHEFVQGSVEDQAAVDRAARGCQAIVHLASWVHRVPRTEADLLELRRAIIEGTRNVANAARRESAHLVLSSTVGVYGSVQTQRCDEGSATAPDTPYAQAKLESEQAALALHAATTVLRIALVYGPHDRGNFTALVRAVDRRRAFIVGGGSNRKSLIYADNLSDRILLCLDRALRGTWIAADNPAPTQRELLALVASALGRRPPPRLPRPVVEAAATAVDLAARAVGAGPTRFRHLATKLAASTEYDGTALDRELDYRPRVSLDEGVRRAVTWYRSKGSG